MNANRFLTNNRIPSTQNQSSAAWLLTAYQKPSQRAFKQNPVSVFYVFEIRLTETPNCKSNCKSFVERSYSCVDCENVLVLRCAGFTKTSLSYKFLSTWYRFFFRVVLVDSI